MSQLDTAIKTVQDCYAAAVAAKDTAAFMALYEPKVRVFDAWERWCYEGSAAWLAAVRSWFDSLGEESVRVSFDETQSAGGLDFAVTSSIVTYSGLSAQGQLLKSMPNRISWGLRFSDQGARIVHEHSSVPVGFADMKAILKR